MLFETAFFAMVGSAVGRKGGKWAGKKIFSFVDEFAGFWVKIQRILIKNLVIRHLILPCLQAGVLYPSNFTLLRLGKGNI